MIKAQDRTLEEWFTRIRLGQLRLPRFQRVEAWDLDNVAGLVDSVLAELPVGSALVLEVGVEEPFVTRRLAGAPEPRERCSEQLLDGQQRLTALWKSTHDLYEDSIFLVRLKEPTADEEGTTPPRTVRITRWTHRDGRRFPLWVDQPAEVLGRGFVPASLLQPSDVAGRRLEWCRAALGNDFEKILEIEGKIRTLHERVKRFNIPLLRLDLTTPPATALDVFVKMNTSAVALSAYDIIVAQFEARTGRAMHDLMRDLREQVPTLEAYTTPEQLILQAAALRAGRAPVQASLRDLDLTVLDTDWESFVAGARWMVQFLEQEGIFDEQRLPTTIVLPVLTALHADVPDRLDAAGNAAGLLRAYLWRAFATPRYEYTSAGRALQDFRGLRDVLQGKAERASVPIFSPEWELPSVERLMQTGWPKRKDTLARAVLAVSLREGALDFADQRRADRDSLRSREYHHLFPVALLREYGRIEDREINRVLNCALITMSTNRNVGAKEPIAYLSERIARASLGEAEIRDRLRTHRIPFTELNVGGYDDLGVERAERVQSDYATFLRARAIHVEAALTALCAGTQPPSI
jgi:hypothetical protein